MDSSGMTLGFDSKALQRRASFANKITLHPKTNSAIQVFAYHCRQVFDYATFSDKKVSAVFAVKDAVA